MSSSNRKISAKNVRVSEHSKAVNDKFFVENEKFEEMYIEEKQQDFSLKIRELEQGMIHELAAKKEEMIQKGYEEGKKIAVQEAEENIKQNLQEIIEQANLIFEDANAYRKKIYEEGQLLREKTMIEERERIINLACQIAGIIVKTKISPEEMNLDGIYEDIVKQINYDSKRIYIRIHPALRDWIEKSVYFSQDNRMEFVYDINLNIADIYVETDKEYIDASVDEKIKELRVKIRGVVQ